MKKFYQLPVVKYTAGYYDSEIIFEKELFGNYYHILLSKDYFPKTGITNLIGLWKNNQILGTYKNTASAFKALKTDAHKELDKLLF